MSIFQGQGGLIRHQFQEVPIGPVQGGSGRICKDKGARQSAPGHQGQQNIGPDLHPKGKVPAIGFRAGAPAAEERGAGKFEDGRQQRMVQRKPFPGPGTALGLDLHCRQVPGPMLPIESGHCPAVATDDRTDLGSDDPEDLPRLQSPRQALGDGGRGLHLPFSQAPISRPPAPCPAG